ncbi:DUF2264 domain-containing protein [Cytophagaceae bacterium DM2B3-1]|uniref:DUF2264 domain-containing protein n=1 Tax=Xanthocytophaga flava TaxID=3048013 RepID=A0ABT7CNI9_9BACT|nr:DUF2264 domain-containing protein [Xanthocytophaga flavus]MDJ1467173.1 DUF2264 domain-containing protein [Xanthocytophaga flavus]MDJ1495250.1 DUF2264 domain-containing protein [Xanthocytophaga flavus]
MKKYYFYSLFLVLLTGILTTAGYAQKKQNAKKTQPLNDRAYWLKEMDKMVRPMVRSLAHDSLRIAMPQVTSVRIDNRNHRIQVQYLEVLGRVLSGIAPWLQLEGGSADEVALRKQYRQWVLEGISHALDSTSKDYMRFDIGGQQLVDASYLAYALIRAPWIWENMNATDKQRLVTSFRTTRKFKPVFSNWLLFSAMTEAFFCKYGYEWDPMRVDYALQQLEQWYVGDGMYTDGVSYAFDYYNSYVIHPYLAAITSIIGQKTNAYNSMTEKIKKRNERYAIIQERLINTDGTYPATGRSIVYRGAAFHHLADMAWRKALPEQLSPAQVRCALTAVIKKTLESPSTYKDGWLTIGLYGSQPDIADFYNNQGSLYICTNIFLPLGLPESDPFWASPAAKWSAQKIWSGEDFHNDHSADLR